jgi:hypothetical protein
MCVVKKLEENWLDPGLSFLDSALTSVVLVAIAVAKVERKPSLPHLWGRCIMHLAD